MTIYEVLLNAQYNINENGGFGIMIGKEQLNNAINLIEQGYRLEDEFQEENLKEDN